MSELTSGLRGPQWFEKVKGELGFNETIDALEISRGALHNCLHGLRRVPDEVVSRALRYLEEREL